MSCESVEHSAVLFSGLLAELIVVADLSTEFSLDGGQSVDTNAPLGCLHQLVLEVLVREQERREDEDVPGGSHGLEKPLTHHRIIRNGKHIA